MAAGDLLIRTHAGTNTVPNAGSSIKAQWDTLDQQFGTFLYTAGDFSLPAGKYLIIYAGYFGTTDTTNNERIEVQGEIHTVSGGVQGGFGQGYIRKSSGDQDCVVRGQMILDLASAEDVFIEFYRTDNSSSGTVDWNYGGITILELDNTHNYGRYRRSTAQSTSGSTVLTYGLDTNDEEDTGFSRSGSVVTVSTAGRYLVTYSLDISQGATGREDVIAYLTDAGAELTGTRSFCYLRGADGTQDGALTWIGVLDFAGGEQVDLRVQCPTSATINIAADGRLQFWQLPVAAATFIKEATTGDYNINADFPWDTTPHIDAAEFTDTDNQTVTLVNGGACLAFATLAQLAPDSVQRAVPLLRIAVNGVQSESMIADAYHRASGGTGYMAINAGGAFFGEAGQTIRTSLTITASTGATINDSGQWSGILLDSIFGVYTPPPVILDVGGDNQILVTSTDVIMAGNRFEALQGTGKLEFWSDIGGTIKVVQTIDSWSDTSIQFDFVQGSLANDSTIYAVVTTDGGEESPPFAVYLGVPLLDDYFTIISDLNPDHWWRFNNDAYADSAGANPITNVVVGGGGAFEAVPICEQNTHSWRVNDQPAGARRECANSTNMNDGDQPTRTMCGWIRFEQIDTALSCLYEEGGGINNVALLQGLGGILIASYADTGDDNAQVYSDFRLEAGRDYHYAWQFDHNGDQEFKLYIDGVKQAVSQGNPLTSGDLDSHTGDISFGGPGSSLEVGGTDVTFPTQLDTRYANWASWTVALSDADILELFRRGARPEDTIASDTPANMQIAVDALTKSRSNKANDIRIFEPSSGVEDDLDLTFDAIVFNSRTSIQVEWRGAGVLTITNVNGANTDVSKCYAPRGGTVVVQEAVPITITTEDINTSSPVQDARVYITAGTGGPLTPGTVILNALTNASGQASTNLDYSADQPIIGRARKASSSPFYRNSSISGIVRSGGLELTVFLIPDE